MCHSSNNDKVHSYKTKCIATRPNRFIGVGSNFILGEPNLSELHMAAPLREAGGMTPVAGKFGILDTLHC